MKITDILQEASDDSGDYQQMLAFTRANRVGGVPDAQQIPLALFKELKKQQQQNQALSSELSDAEKRINQALGAGELSRQELGMHRTELDRERAAGERQQAAVGQLGQQYSERERASKEQIEKLSDQLQQVRNMPGVNEKAAQELEKQIKELGEKSVPVARLAELESSIAAVQNMQTVDDTAIKDLLTQVQDAQAATQELQKTKTTVGKDAEQAANDALDQVEQMRQDLNRLNQVAGRISSVVADALPAQIDSLNARLQELDSESEHQYDELLKHDTLLNKLTGQGGGDGGQTAEPELPDEPPRPTTPPQPTPGVPDDNDDLEKDQLSRAAALAAMAKAQILDPDSNPHWPKQQPEEVAESRFRDLIKWATGKKL
jgi:chromosome segregation ATPase